MNGNLTIHGTFQVKISLLVHSFLVPTAGLYVVSYKNIFVFLMMEAEMFSAMLFYLNNLLQLSAREDFIQIIYPQALTPPSPHPLVDRQL
jgi:hypothetical protein